MNQNKSKKFKVHYDLVGQKLGLDMAKTADSRCKQKGQP